MYSYTNHAVLPAGQTSGTCAFSVWSVKSPTVDLILYDSPEAYKSGQIIKVVPMTPAERGWFTAQAEIGKDWLYMFRLADGKQYPDPRSAAQPLGVHGPSGLRTAAPDDLVPPSWHGVEYKDLIIYELHPAAFVGKKPADVSYWAAAAEKLEYIKDLGATAVEVMPVAESPGASWGYDGVYIYAPTCVYGTPDELRAFVARAHELGLAVILDVVYNHFGPEGCYLGAISEYFDSRYSNPWGAAINYCGENSDPVRQFVTENAVYWIREFGFDGLRLDATDTITDFSGRHILADIAYAVHKYGKYNNRMTFVTAEDDDNYRIKIDPPTHNGYGLDGVWNIDFHHALHALVTGERSGLYEDFSVSERFKNPAEALLKAFVDGWVYDGFYRERYKKTWGTGFEYIDSTRLIVYNQTHDQAGNCAESKRLGTKISPAAARFAAAVTILSPFTPLLFMGEEYGEQNPFPFFTTFEDEGLKRAVRRGRQRDMEYMHQRKLPKVADPFDPKTFEQASLSWTSDVYEQRLQLYKDLIAVRKQTGVAGQSFKPYAQANGAGLLYFPTENSEAARAKERGYVSEQAGFGATLIQSGTDPVGGENQPSILTWRWTVSNKDGFRQDNQTYIAVANVTPDPVPVPPDMFDNLILSTEAPVYGGSRTDETSAVLLPFEVAVRRRA
ncbi:MAG: hypothetical protein IJG38_08840 [Thermoguttaceae bacterium]|nr:hypothetical protein [Thermoguttaceae bacterium]